jgi:predicted O-methyltransferase YrrM
MMLNPEIVNIQGFMQFQELEWLFEQAQKMGSIVEIGSWRGLSTYALLTGCSGKVYAVDTWQGSPDEINAAHAEAKTQDIYAQFYANVGKFPNLIVRKMDSVEASRHHAPKSIDMVFIDGCHSRDAVIADLKAWIPICKKLLCGHDLGQAGVMPALQEVNIDYKKEVGSLWSYVL